MSNMMNHKIAKAITAASTDPLQHITPTSVISEFLCWLPPPLLCERLKHFQQHNAIKNIQINAFEFG
jgi:hypothetical protein